MEDTTDAAPTRTSVAGASLRQAGPEDAEALRHLWTRAGLHFDAGSLVADLGGVLAHGPELVLVIERQGELIASVVGAFDGRRGWINRLATDPAWRGRGLARLLVRELEDRLASRGCLKVNLLVERENAAVATFYEELGYRQDDLIFMERWLPDAE